MKYFFIDNMLTYNIFYFIVNRYESDIFITLWKSSSYNINLLIINI